MAVLVQSLIDQSRLLSMLKNNQFFSDDDIGGFLNDAAMELDDIFTDAVEHYSQQPFDFTLVGGVGGSTVPLPSNFEKAQILLKDPDTTPCRIDPLPNLAERGSTTAGLIPGLGRCYLIEGDVLEIMPVTSAAGIYRLLYTPQLGALWPSPPDYTARLATTVALPANTAVGTALVASSNGALSVDSTAVLTSDILLIKNEVTGANNGVYIVSNPGSGGAPFVLARVGVAVPPALMTSVRVTAGTVNANTSWRLDVFAGILGTSPLVWNVPTLPARLVPWQLFLKVHAAVAIVQGRKQPMPDGLEAKLEQQRQRAVKLSANRTEGVTQAPIQRRWRGFWGDDAGSAGLG